MIELFESQNRVFGQLEVSFKRTMFVKLHLEETAIMILVVRGTGKSNLFFQYLKQNFSGNEVL